MSNQSAGAWRRYNIFLSSTFKDMDFERDVIKFKVIPALNRRFRDRRVELQAIDLRLGVNTSNMSEAESERKVLSVCTSCIDSARPFFIGLIGRRYGWVPPVERWREFMAGLSDEERQILADTAGCSVTEMEIVYGALSQGSFDSSHVLFFLRDDSSYDGIPEDLKSTFCDSDPDNIKRLEALKAKVHALFGERGGEDDRCTPYHLDWKDGHFTSDEFEKMVTEQLARQIEAETALEDEQGTATWWAREKELEESTLLRLLPGSIELDVYDDDEEEEEDVEEEEEDDSSDVAVWYVQGYGASTHMAQDYAQWDEDTDVIRLLAVFGLSEYSSSMRPVLARWIHELAERVGREDLPEDELMLGKMPEPELFDLFEELVKEVAEDDYIYIYMDDVEALETTSPKDLYMPWLDHVKDDVNVMINLQDESEAREKVLEAYPYLSRKLMLGVEADEDAATELIVNYEQTFFLELPGKIKKQMIKAATSKKKTLSPLKVHSIFRIFESLTQEDFREIRGRKGSQIDAINGYLEDIWEEMPDATYDIMTFMVNQIVKNLALGENMRQAIWTIAAAPGGLRESDVAHFAGGDWDMVQFYRAMNFLHDFFYEDHARHLWRAKYITRPEDGLGERQKHISEYILTLDPHDSLRETMGLYFALGGCEPSHFAPYMVGGDYVHGQQMSDMLRFHGPQIRQLLREGYLDSDDFENYCKALPVEQRLQLIMDVLTALADLKEERERLHARMSAWLEDVNIESLSGADAFTCCSILAGQRDSIPHLEKAMEAARRSASLDFPGSKQLISMASSLLIMLYQKKGMIDKAQALRGGAGGGATSAKERFTALFPLVAQAGTKSSLVSKNKRMELLDSFFDQYYAIVDDLEPGQEAFEARFKSYNVMINALSVLMTEGQHERALAEFIRFIPSMQLFYRAENFFSWAEALQTYLSFHMLLTLSTWELMKSKGIVWQFGLTQEPLARVADLAYCAAVEGGNLLKEIDPDNEWVKNFRKMFTDNAERVELVRKFRGDTGLEEIDKLIQYAYAETQN
ncbi:MAG: DUF4062 domain-containing protein [Bacteroidales bacterium]|nr:DUF4062 domain-containing protein [Bacteroidales bacterium]